MPSKKRRKKKKKENQSLIDFLPVDILKLIGTYQAIQAKYILLIWNSFDREINCLKMFSTEDKAKEYGMKWLNQYLDPPILKIEDFYPIERLLNIGCTCRYMRWRIIEAKIDEEFHSS